MPTSIKVSTRAELIAHVAKRRAHRILYDARNCTSIEQEFESLVIRNTPLERFTTPELVAEWRQMTSDGDPEFADYTPPCLNLSALTRKAR